MSSEIGVLKPGLVVNFILSNIKERGEAVTWRKLNILTYIIDGLSYVMNGEGVVDDDFFMVDGSPCLESAYYLSRCGLNLNNIAEPVVYRDSETKVRTSMLINAESPQGEKLAMIVNMVLDSFVQGNDYELSHFITANKLIPEQLEKGFEGPGCSPAINPSDFLDEFNACFKDDEDEVAPEDCGVVKFPGHNA